MNNFDELFKWWVKRYEFEIRMFFEPKIIDSFYIPTNDIDQVILDIMDLPGKIRCENSQIFKAMMSIDFFGLFKRLKEYCQPLHEEWKRRTNETPKSKSN